MGEIMKFVYVMIIYLFMFNVATGSEFIFTKKLTSCDSSKDCRSFLCYSPKFPVCKRGICECI
ncbi:putative Late nodulin [Medicago truncatula]|uniref:Nodule Cysteine-Rich (NCR) secreted peptide n=1 Tax=Medicago truncatula TaxID=3880 RepID=Q1RU35_MEDTR|nr:hypothetical protein MtrDRAFT_AC153125g28v2 [Medicago truncatula]ABS31415.1 nodule-specific cysteine-rich peptide 171 [Medicago truncatula]AET02298.1 Nodule Cysteine-Rich (NCR) secreted peptide [Medicago truncatula]AFK44589.1 unknown [Medicago truncatula]RHN40269.1 putative Late nodulin [Medicago truncatula]